MLELPRLGAVQPLVGFVEDFAALLARLYLALDHVEDGQDMLPGFVLLVGWLVSDGRHAGVVGKVAAESGAKIENVELARFDLAIARRATPLAAGIIVAGAG